MPSIYKSENGYLYIKNDEDDAFINNNSEARDLAS